MTRGLISLARDQACQPAGFGIVCRKDTSTAVVLLHAEELGYGDPQGIGWPSGDSSLSARVQGTYRLGRAAAKQALSAFAPGVVCSEVFIDKGVFGFPVVKSSQLHNTQVSITHCDTVALALAYPESHPMGIDLERVHPERIATSGSMLLPSERALIDALGLPHATALTIVWTMKEALSKVLKCGLTADWSVLAPSRIEETDYGWRGLFAGFGQYQSLSWVCSSWVCSVVLPAQTTAGLEELVTGLTLLE